LRKPDYQYEKRQKDLAKRKKQDEKRQRRLDRAKDQAERSVEGGQGTSQDEKAPE
jgi:hypothetical protein